MSTLYIGSCIQKKKKKKKKKIITHSVYDKIDEIHSYFTLPFTADSLMKQ